YDYDDTSSPLAVHDIAPSALSERRTMRPQARPEMVGASTKKLALTGSAQTTTLAIKEPSGPTKVRGKAGKAPTLGKTYLQIENVVSKQSHATYEVYVDLPGKPDATAYQEHYGGAMDVFGVRHASTRSDKHSGSGLSFSLDITQLEERLRAKGAWDEKNIRVTFSPRGPGGEASQRIPEHEAIKIGRVS